MRFSRLFAITAAAAVGGCQSSPTDPFADLGPTGATVAGDGISATIVVDEGNPNRKTYTFDDLSQNCGMNVTTSGLYEDLAFPPLVYLAKCPTANGTMGLMPSEAAVLSAEVRVGLPEEASVVSIDVYRIGEGGVPTLVAYDANDEVIAQAADSASLTFVTLEVEGGGTPIVEIGLVMPQLRVRLDNLTITYGSGEDPTDPGDDPGEGSTDPEIKADCMRGGWEQFGFRNQGQCVRFIETGKDSREVSSDV